MSLFFVYPGEARHEDLGMIPPDDTILIFSNSGETTELYEILAYEIHTTLTTLSMALGDALAIALLKEKNFSPP